MSASPNSTKVRRNPNGTFAKGTACIKQKRTVTDRFWPKVHKTDTCWLWIGAINPNGYGRFQYNGSIGYAHRWAYEQAHGPIPDGMDIDHLCRVRHCVNPDHMEAVSRRKNILRGEHPSAKLHRNNMCKHGHVRNSDNAYINSHGWWICRVCRRNRKRQDRITRIKDED